MFDTATTAKDLERMAPGPELAVALAEIDRQNLTGYDRVLLMKARARQVAHDQAELYADIESVSDAVVDIYHTDDPDEVFETTCSELRAALTLTRRGAEIQVDLAFQLRERLPAVWTALSEGKIDLSKATVLCDQTTHLPRETARQVVTEALLGAEAMTTGQLRAHLQRLIINVDPAAAMERYERRVRERRVVVEAGEDGTANLLGLSLPPADANAAMRRINRLARALRRSGDRRRMDQIRADILLDLLRGRNDLTDGGQRAIVDIKVDLTTLAGLDENPGQIPGWGPVVSDIARQVAREQEDSEWRITITDPEGVPVAVTTTRRRPTAAQRRAVEARNPTCVFPGCRMPAADCDLDHEIPWAETHLTSARHLEPFCRHDHNNRHKRHWKVRQLRPGTYQLTSPLGHTYMTGHGGR